MDTRTQTSGHDPAAPGAGAGPAHLAALEESVRRALPDYLADLERLVNTDCGSYAKAGVDEVGRWTAAFLERLGARVEVRPHDRLGDTIIATFDGGPPDAPRVLMLGHLDTVFPDGTAAERPFEIRDGIARGPGVTDMKSGLLSGLYAIAALRELIGFDRPLPFGRLVFVANPDEEIGSPSSTPWIREVAATVDVALSLECARANGDIVSARKGTTDVHLTVLGRAAHAGVEPEKGRSAILEAARLVRDLHALNGRWPDVTVNVGVIEGGTRPNVVPERCLLKVDVRAFSRADFEAVKAEMRRLVGATTVPDTRIEWSERSSHDPMEKLDRSERLVDHVGAIASRLGFEVRDAATGGASDANTTAGMGIPTIDGLGPVGGNDHSPEEYLEVGSIVPRTTLLAGLLLAVARDPQIRTWRVPA